MIIFLAMGCLFISHLIVDGTQECLTNIQKLADEVHSLKDEIKQDRR